MPEVCIDATLAGKSRVALLLNSGARDLELVVPKGLTKKLGIKSIGKTKLFFGGVTYTGEIGSTEVRVENPETKEERTGVLEVISLPDKVLDRPLLGVVGQEKLRIVPDTVAGKAIFK